MITRSGNQIGSIGSANILVYEIDHLLSGSHPREAHWTRIYTPPYLAALMAKASPGRGQARARSSLSPISQRGPASCCLPRLQYGPTATHGSYRY